MGNGRSRAALVAAGLRWRIGGSAAMFVVALLGVGVGAYGPLYFHGADQSVLDTSLARLRSTRPG